MPFDFGHDPKPLRMPTKEGFAKLKKQRVERAKKARKPHPSEIFSKITPEDNSDAQKLKKRLIKYLYK